MSNGNNNTSQGGGPSQGGYPTNAWPFASVGFDAAAVAAGTPTTNAGADGYSNLGGSSIGRSGLLGGGSGSLFAAPGSSRRYGARTADPYASSLARRRQHSSGMASSQRDKRTQNRGQSQGGEPERKRVVVACLRCRKRKIRCSGDDGQGGSCTNCKNAHERECLFMRVQAGSLAEMRKKEGERRMADTAVVNTFSYDVDTCRQYQSRGAASVGAGMSAHSTAYGAPSGASNFAAPGNVMYSWAPGLGATYNDNSHGVGGTTNNGGASTGYGLPYHGMPYHGMPSPDTSYMGENDLMERPTTTSMADAGGAFALQSMSAGLPTSSGSQAGPFGHNHHSHNHSPMTSTGAPRSYPGPATVLGSSRGVPQSAVFSGSRTTPQQYPSPVTTPITSGVSPVWTGYEQSPYGTSAAMPTSMAAQSLERLPDLYSATPPPPPSSAGGGGAAPASQSGSQRGEDDVLNGGGDGSNNGGSHHHQSQQHQQQHFGYD